MEISDSKDIYPIYSRAKADLMYILPHQSTLLLPKHQYYCNNGWKQENIVIFFSLYLSNFIFIFLSVSNRIQFKTQSGGVNIIFHSWIYEILYKYTCKFQLRWQKIYIWKEKIVRIFFTFYKLIDTTIQPLLYLSTLSQGYIKFLQQSKQCLDIIKYIKLKNLYLIIISFDWFMIKSKFIQIIS